MKVLRKIIEIDENLCDGCGQCVPGCEEGALKIIDGKARLVSERYCDGLGACIGHCPTGALRVVDREVEAFDEEAVKLHLEPKSKIPADKAMVCECPSTHIQSFAESDARPSAGVARNLSSAQEESALSHWPIQIRLAPAGAPFLKGADLLILADCSAVAYAHLHRDLLRGRAVLMGCPKFDSAQDYILKFAEIFKTAGIRSITVVFMEVPCCSGLPVILKKAMALAETRIPMREIKVSAKGRVLSEEETADGA